MKTAHELANELLDGPDLPVFVFNRWSEELSEDPEPEERQHGYFIWHENRREWVTALVVVIA